MTTADFADWMERYVRPQERGDAEPIKELFAEAGVYWYGPYFPPRHGVQTIYEHHRDALARQKDNKFEYEILATTEEYGIARFRLTLKRLDTDENMEYEGILLVYLDAANKCTRFEEWYHKRALD